MFDFSIKRDGYSGACHRLLSEAVSASCSTVTGRLRRMSRECAEIVASGSTVDGGVVAAVSSTISQISDDVSFVSLIASAPDMDARACLNNLSKSVDRMSSRCGDALMLADDADGAYTEAVFAGCDDLAQAASALRSAIADIESRDASIVSSHVKRRSAMRDLFGDSRCAVAAFPSSLSWSRDGDAWSLSLGGKTFAGVGYSGDVTCTPMGDLIGQKAQLCHDVLDGARGATVYCADAACALLDEIAIRMPEAVISIRA